MPVKKSKVKSKKVKAQLKIKNFKFLLVVFTFTFYILPLKCYAAPCYGTKMPQRKEAFWGLRTHTVFKRYLENEYGKLRSTQHFLLLSYGVFDWLSLDLKGGAGYIKQRPTESSEIDYPTYLGGGYGFRWKLYDKEKLNLVFGFQHLSIHPETVSLRGVKHKAVLDDWQFSALASYRFKKITPYLATRWSKLDYIHWVDNDRNRVKSDLTKSMGLILGLDLSLTQKIWLNLEGSIFDSEAFAASLNFSF